MLLRDDAIGRPLGGVGMMHTDSVDDEGVDVGDSPGRNERHRLVQLVLLWVALIAEKDLSTRAVTVWSLGKKRSAIVEAHRYEIIERVYRLSTV